MNDDEVWRAIDLQRTRTADLLDELAPGEWAAPSLCEGWTVRDVAAHLTLQEISLGQGIAMGLRVGLRHPGGMNTVIRESARGRAALPTDEIVAALRATVGSRRHNVGLTHRETLLDIVVHGQDIALPLGRQLHVDPAAAAEAADRLWGYRASRSGRRKARVFRPVPADGLRLAATDADWAVGAGPEVRGPALALLLLLTGRTALLPRLTGPGVASLTERANHGAPPAAGPDQGRPR